MRTPLLLACPVLLLAQDQPTFYAAYEDGLEHERAGRWQQAAAAFRRATALRPKPAAKVVIYGNNLLLNYHPYAHTARCLLELGQAEAARSLLAQSEALGEPESARSAVQARLAPHAGPAPAPPPAPVAAPAPPVPEPVHAPPVEATPPEPRPAAPPEPGRPAPATPSSPTVQVRPAEPRQPAPGVQAAPPANPAPVGPPATPERSEGWWRFPAVGLAGALVLWLILRRRRAGPGQPYQDPVQVGRYRIGRLLGRGGFASTYLGWDPESGAKVAVKVLHPFRQEDPEFLGRFRQESRLGTLLDHPNLVRLLDRGPEAGLQWLVMEFVSGERLDRHLQAEGPLGIRETVRLAREIAEAMAHAHALGITHRDLKPSNIMLTDGRAKVMDFGISRSMDAETLTTTYAFLGTPLYAAPEAQLKTQVGPASDRYSLGVILFEMLAGAPPFRGETPFEILDQHRTADLPDLAALRPDAPGALRDLVGALCRKAPAERPGDEETLAVLAALERDLEAGTPA